MAKNFIWLKPARKERTDTYTYAELYEEYFKQMVNAFQRVVHDYHLAEDLTQETMTKVFLYWERINHEWITATLKRMADRTYIDYWNKKSLDIVSQIDDELEYDNLEDGSMDPINLMVDMLSLEETLSALPKSNGHIDLRDLYVRFYILKEDLEHLCDVFETKPSKIYLSLCKIRTTLLSHMENTNDQEHHGTTECQFGYHQIQVPD